MMHRRVSRPRSRLLRGGWRAGGGITWPSRPSPGQRRLRAAAARCPLPGLAPPGPVQFTASRSLPELLCRSCAKPLHAADGLPGSACTRRALNKEKGFRLGRKDGGRDPSEAGSGELVALAQSVLPGERCHPERKWQLPIIASLGTGKKHRLLAVKAA